MSLLAVLLLLLLPSLGLSSTCYVNFARFDLFGNDLFPYFALATENQFGNDNQYFRELASVAMNAECAVAVDFSALKVQKAAKDFDHQFRSKAPEMADLSYLGSYASSTLPVFERICLLSGVEALPMEQKILLEAILVDLLCVIHPSIIGLPLGVDDLLLLISGHFAINSDRHVYDLEFSNLYAMIEFFSGPSREFALKLLSRDPNKDLIEEMVVLSFERGAFATLWWLLESGHWSWAELSQEQVKGLVVTALNLDSINLLFLFKQIIKRFGGNFPIPDGKNELVPLPLLWFVGVEVAKRSSFGESDLLEELLEEESFNWDICDEFGLTILGRWIWSTDSTDIPQNLINGLLRRELISGNVAALIDSEPVGFVRAIGMISEAEGRIELVKLRRFLLEVPLVDRQLVVLEAFQSGELWLFFSLLSDAVALNALSPAFLRSEILDPLLKESRFPLELAEKFEKSHAAFLVTADHLPSILKYYSKWEQLTPNESIPPATNISSSLSRSLSWSRSRSKSRSRSQGSSKSPIAQVNISSNVLSSVLDLLEARQSYLTLHEEYKQSL